MARDDDKTITRGQRPTPFGQRPVPTNAPPRPPKPPAGPSGVSKPSKRD